MKKQVYSCSNIVYMVLILHICRLEIYNNEETEQPRALCDSCNSIFSFMCNVL